jgi:DNA-binding MarR family transcriptional regulator
VNNDFKSGPPAAHGRQPGDLDTEFLESLLGYNTRRAYLTILSVFFDRMAAFGLRPVDFSLLCLIHYNPGITSRRLSEALSIQPPNLVGKIAALLAKGWVSRKTDDQDKRALGLKLTDTGLKLILEAEAAVASSEVEGSSQLNPQEREQLIALLKKVYIPQL